MGLRLPGDIRNPVDGGLEWVVGELGVASRHVYVGVAQQLADHQQPLADQQAAAGVTVP